MNWTDEILSKFMDVIKKANVSFLNMSNIEEGVTVAVALDDNIGEGDITEQTRAYLVDDKTGRKYTTSLIGIASMTVGENLNKTKLKNVEVSRDISRNEHVSNLQEFLKKKDDGTTVKNFKFKVIKRVPRLNNRGAVDSKGNLPFRYATWCYSGYGEYMAKINAASESQRAQVARDNINELLGTDLQVTDEKILKENIVYTPIFQAVGA